MTGRSPSRRVPECTPLLRRRIVDLCSGERRELGKPEPYVVAVGIVELPLPGRVERPVRPRVRTGACNPLPVAAVGGCVAVDEVLHEMSGADAPVDAQMLDEHGGGDHALAVR